MTTQILDDFVSPSSVRWNGRLDRGKGRMPNGKSGALVRGVIVTEQLQGDWRGFQSLQCTIYNPLSQAVIGGIEIWDREGWNSPEREYGDYVDRRRSFLLGEGVTHVVIQIDPIQTTRGGRMLNLAEVVKVALRFPEPGEGEPPLIISSLRLSDIRDEPDRMSSAAAGDAVLFMRHLDISCCIYEADRYVEPEDVQELERRVIAEKERLTHAVRIAEINGKQVLYARAALVAADIALIGRPMLSWHFSPAAKRRNLEGALEELEKHRLSLEALLSSREHEDDEDDSNLPLPIVKGFPDYASLQIDGMKFVDAYGSPALICAMSYHNEGTLLQFFAPEQHKAEIYAVGGGSRYDIEWSPVYEAFHRYYPETERVGWKGWCGHLIKDQWAMGGRKENVVICLENKHILDAIIEYNRMHEQEWKSLPHLMYIILGYELTYMCYCEQSIATFREWLQERHGTIDVLNERWGTSYPNFSQVVPPETEGMAPVKDANRAAWFDWADWNTRRFTEHLKWAKNEVRKLHPSIPICAGGTSSMFSPNNGMTGIDEEQIINEVDDVILHEGSDLLGIDLFHALADEPKPLVDPEQGGDCSRWLLNYLHGKTAISKFWWPKQPSRQFPSSTLGSPLHGNMPIAKVAEHLYTALDVRRLNEEITAFWDIPKQAAILYSRTNVLQVAPEMMTADTTPYLKTMRACYEAARCLDAAVTFVSEKQLLAGRADRFKLLIIPAATYVPEDVFQAIDRYVKAGGHVLVLPESLLADEYLRPQNYLSRWGIHISRTVKPDVIGYGELVQRYDQNLEQAVEYSEGVSAVAGQFADGFAPLALTTSGLFQYVDIAASSASSASSVTSASTASLTSAVVSTAEGESMLVEHRTGDGVVWYVCGELTPISLAELIDRLYDRASVDRPLKVTDRAGRRIPGVEARLVRRKHDDLVYVANESGAEAEFVISTDRPIHAVRELRSLAYFPSAEGTIRDKETLLFSLQEDPSVRFARTAP